METSSNKKSATIELLKHRNYLKLLIATLIGRFGDSLDSIAYGWMVYKLTGSTLLMGTLFAVNAIPNLLFSPIFGAIVDNRSKKKIMAFGELGRGIVVMVTALLLMIGYLRTWHLFVFTFLNSTLETLSTPAKMSIMPLILPKDKMLSASSLSTSISSFAELMGLSVAGVIVATIGVEGAILIDGATFIIASIILVTLKYEENLKLQESNKKNNYLGNIKEGFEFIRKDYSIFLIILVAAFVNFLLTPLNVLMPAYVDTLLASGPKGMSVIGLSITIGMIVSGLLVSEFGDRFKEKNMIVYGFMLLGAAYSLLSLPNFITQLIPGLVLAAIMFFLIGFSVPVVSSPLRAYTLTNTPQEMLGRVGAFMNMVSLSALPLGGAITGFLSTLLSIEKILIVTGIMIFLISILLKVNKKFFPEENVI